MTTGQRIQRARKKAGLSQRQLGEKLGLSASMIGQWENDLRNPKVETLQRIAKALNTHIFDLTGIGQMLDEFNGIIEYTVEEKDGSPPSPETLAEIEEFLSRDPREAYDDFSDDEKSRFWEILTKPLQARLNDAFSKLNDTGQQEAIHRVEELTEIPRYRLQDGPQDSPASQDGSDTTPPPDGPETPPEGRLTGRFLWCGPCHGARSKGSRTSKMDSVPDETPAAESDQIERGSNHE